MKEQSCEEGITCGMLLNRSTWSERVEPGNTSPPIAMPAKVSMHIQNLHEPKIEIKCSW